MQEFYKVMFFDNRDKQYYQHYVFTRDMALSKLKIEGEEPYVEVVSWEKIDEDQLPPLVVVIQK